MLPSLSIEATSGSRISGKPLELRLYRFQQRDVVPVRTLAGQGRIQAQNRNEQEQFERRQDGSGRPQQFERRADILETPQRKRDAGAVKGADLADTSRYRPDFLKVAARPDAQDPLGGTGAVGMAGNFGQELVEFEPGQRFRCDHVGNL